MIEDGDPPTSAAAQWREALAEWAIPEEILASAPESPWCFPPELFGDLARSALVGPPTPTHLRIMEALPPGGTLLDVGSGAGAASLPVASAGSRVIAVDQDPRMLEAMAELGAGRVTVVGIAGRWPEVAGEAGEVDVAVSANVAYNVADLGPFVEALTAAARHRVVLELSAEHPQSPLNPLWEQFWGPTRPDRPTADDARAVVAEVLGVVPEVERWSRARSFMGERGPRTVAWTRRRLCLPSDRDPEVAAALEHLPEMAPSRAVTLWWPGRAGRAMRG